MALAMKEQLGTDKVAVCPDGVWEGLQRYEIPSKARTFILNFDSGLPVDPLALLMDAVPKQGEILRRFSLSGVAALKNASAEEKRK